MDPEPSLRPFVNEPGEPLVSCVAPHETAMRMAGLLELTGLEPDDVVTSPTATTPLPLYPAQWPEGRRRWSGVRAEAMWHPLMWLPERLAARRLVDTGTGPRIEDDELWAARVMAEMSAGGFYSEPDGQWVDVLALHDIDIDRKEDLDRVASWLDGQPDLELDSLDLDTALANEQYPDWALEMAWDAVQVLRPVAWVIHADALMADVDDALENQVDLSTDDLAMVARMTSVLGSHSFDALPFENEAQWWLDQAPGEETSRGEVTLALTTLRERLSAIHEEFHETAHHTAVDGDEIIETILANLEEDSEDEPSADDTVPVPQDDPWESFSWGDRSSSSPAGSSDERPS